MDRKQMMLRMRLESALRTALACIIVGCTTLYGPSHFQNHVPFPSFSYVTAILIVSDSTLGDTIRGSWDAFCATVQVVPISILSLWVFGPASFSPATAAVAVVLMSFLAGMPRCTDLLCKRIAFGQVVIVYVGAVAYGDAPGAVLRPLHLATSTGLGASASVIATFLPFPRLAISEVRKLFQLYTENASARTSLCIKAFLSQDSPSATEAICQSKPYNETGDKLLQNIKLLQEGLPWERHVRDLRCQPNIPGYQLQDIEMAIRGMEMASISCPLFPVSDIDQELSIVLQGMDIQLGLKLRKAPSLLPKEAIAVLDTKNEYFDKSILSLAKFSPTQEQLPTIFLLLCMGFLFDSTSGNIQISNTSESRASKVQSKDRLQRILGILEVLPRVEELLFAFKCSISLGLAVLFGMLFNKQNAYWSGLIIAISFATGVQPTFTLANARAQGTAMGTAYGVVGCFLFPNSRELRFLTLLPWIIFVGFLRHSRMYGQAGGISAVIGALLILGRQRYGPPHEFAITRLTEAFVGLSCLILVELVLQRARAATLAKNQLSRSLRALEECIQHIVFPSHQQDMPVSLSTQKQKDRQRTLKSHVNDLKELRKHAETEPNFYYKPFRAACYDKLLGSLSKMIILLQLVANILEALPQISNRLGDEWKELEELITSDIQDFKEDVSTSFRYYEEITKIKSLAFREKGQQENKIFHDLEAGELPNRSVLSSKNSEAAENILSSYIQHSTQAVEKICTSICEEGVKGKIVLYLGSLGFCMKSLMAETTAIENEIKQLIRWENPSRYKLL
ncbi:uncharacterized protein LOC141714383 [Apium graveolens]|uniref:uncharacterized protein LOC141714383 n=1 Tax=Apium graveolens TaxID=4045 RepID=UPI003D7AC2FE